MSAKPSDLKTSPLAPQAFPAMPVVAGVSLAACACGLKKNGKTDLMLAEMVPGTTVAGVFRCIMALLSVATHRRSHGHLRGLIAGPVPFR